MDIASSLLSDGLGEATGLHRAQDLYALFYGWVGGEEAFGALLEPFYGVDDVEVGGGAVGDLQDLSVAADLLQRVGEAFRVAGELDGGRVGEVLALARDGELEEPCEERGQDGQHNGYKHHDQLYVAASLAPSPTTAAEPEPTQEEVGDENRRAHEDPDEHRVADVVVAYVGHLVRDDALQLVPVELLQEARGDGDGGVLGIPARREGVGGGVLDDVDLRHREPAGYRHLLDDVVENWGLFVCHLLRARGGEHHPVAAVVGGEAGYDPHGEGEGEAEDGAYRVPDPGVPDHVAKDRHEREEADDQEHAVAPVDSYTVPEGTVVEVPVIC